MEFVDQMARKIIVDWCDRSLVSATATIAVFDDVYAKHALEKRWIALASDGIRDKGQIGIRILASGWDTAARFLRR
jgi:hypothetical protein